MDYLRQKALSVRANQVYRASLREDAEALLEGTQKPSEGIYYWVKLPSGWRLFPLRRDEAASDPEMTHAYFWNVCARWLAEHWSEELGRDPEKIFDELEPHTYGFPRGRITLMRENHPVILWGGEGIFTAKPGVERFFGLSKANPKWELDYHEKCLPYDRDMVRNILGIKETWPAAHFRAVQDEA